LSLYFREKTKEEKRTRKDENYLRQAARILRKGGGERAGRVICVQSVQREKGALMRKIGTPDRRSQKRWRIFSSRIQLRSGHSEEE